MIGHFFAVVQIFGCKCLCLVNFRPRIVFVVFSKKFKFSIEQLIAIHLVLEEKAFFPPLNAG